MGLLDDLKGFLGQQGAGASSPDDVANLAHQVHQNNPGVVEQMSSFYAQHPTLVKTLGSDGYEPDFLYPELVTFTVICLALTSTTVCCG